MEKGERRGPIPPVEAARAREVSDGDAEDAADPAQHRDEGRPEGGQVKHAGPAGGAGIVQLGDGPDGAEGLDDAGEEAADDHRGRRRRTGG